MGIQVNKMAEVTLQLSDQKSTISHLESEVSSLQSIIETDRKRHTAEVKYVHMSLCLCFLFIFSYMYNNIHYEHSINTNYIIV